MPNVRASDEPELQFHQPDETLTRESVIADRRTATPEDIASSDEMDRLVQFALAAAKPRDREVFILHTIEGFSVAEIAAITDRKPEAISASIVAAREHLRRSPAIADRFKNTGLAKDGHRFCIVCCIRRTRVNDHSRRHLELAQFQGHGTDCAISFYFQPSRPKNKSHREDAILAKDLVRQALREAEKDGRNGCARSDLQRILDVAAEWQGNQTAKVVFACGSRNIWREFDLPPQFASTELFVNRRFHLKPLVLALRAQPRLWMVVAGPPPRPVI